MFTHVEVGLDHAGEISIVAPGNAPTVGSIPATAPYAPTPVLDLLHAAAALLADTAPAAPALVREIERDFPASLERRPAQLVRAADARPAELTALVRAAGFTDLDDVRARVTRELGSARTTTRRPAAARPSERPDVGTVLRREATAVTDTLESARLSGALELAAGEILGSRRRWVFGELHSRGYAQLFATDLSASLGQVTLIEPTAAGVLAAIGDVQRRDSLTVFTFRPYSRMAARLSRHFGEQGATVVTVTDDGHGSDSTHVLRTVTPDDKQSAAATAALASTLAELVAAGAKGAARRAAMGRELASELQLFEGTNR